MAAEPFVGEIAIFGFNFAPRGWATCSGQLLAISQNTALFSLLGTTYGGNGQTTFGLPDLRGRAAMHFGQGPGLTPVDLGEMAGQTSITLIPNEIPSHTHLVSVNATEGSVPSPTNNFFAVPGADRDLAWYNAGSSGVINMSPAAVGLAGSSLPHNNQMPYLCINYCIALQGIYPSRN